MSKKRLRIFFQLKRKELLKFFKTLAGASGVAIIFVGGGGLILTIIFLILGFLTSLVVKPFFIYIKQLHPKDSLFTIYALIGMVAFFGIVVLCGILYVIETLYKWIRDNWEEAGRLEWEEKRDKQV